jgi:hypothetical protein
MSVSQITPSALQTLTTDALVRLAAIRERQERLQDLLNETRHPELSYSDPAWDCPDRWELGDGGLANACLIPPDIDLDAESGRDWPSGGTA